MIGLDDLLFWGSQAISIFIRIKEWFSFEERKWRQLFPEARWFGKIYTKNPTTEKYASLMKKVMRDERNRPRVRFYETMNTFLPFEILRGSMEEKLLLDLKDISENTEATMTRLQVLDRYKITYWWLRWFYESSEQQNHRNISFAESVHNFSDYFCKELLVFHDRYGGKFCVKFAFDSELLSENRYYGEYVVFNRIYIFRYNTITKSLTLLTGKELTSEYAEPLQRENALFERLPSITDISNYKDKIVNYLESFYLK